MNAIAPRGFGRGRPPLVEGKCQSTRRGKRCERNALHFGKHSRGGGVSFREWADEQSDGFEVRWEESLARVTEAVRALPREQRHALARAVIDAVRHEFARAPIVAAMLGAGAPTRLLPASATTGDAGDVVDGEMVDVEPIECRTHGRACPADAMTWTPGDKASDPELATCDLATRRRARRDAKEGPDPG